MLVTRTSGLTGKVHEREIDCTEEQMRQYTQSRQQTIQEIFPNLSADDREFIMTGITPEEWEKTFGNEGE